VRFVSIQHASWDHHSNLNDELSYNAGMADQPVAALLKDLKQRGLLDSTFAASSAARRSVRIAAAIRTSQDAIIIRSPSPSSPRAVD
jgi:Protein of unknown function (DUF1501)